MSAFVRTGGTFRVGLRDPNDGTIEPIEFDNTILKSATALMDVGLDSNLPIQIGSSDEPTVSTTTGVYEPIEMRVTECTHTPAYRSKFEENDERSISQITGSTYFRMEIIGDGIVKEIAIDQFCRAILPIPVYVGEGMILEVWYTFDLYLTIPRIHSPEYSGEFWDVNAEEVAPIQTTATGYLLYTAEENYQWFHLFAGFEEGKAVFSYEYEVEMEHSPAAIVRKTKAGQRISYWVVFPHSQMIDTKVGAVLYGNHMFGIQIAFTNTNTMQPARIEIPANKQLRIDFDIVWDV